MEVQQQEMKSLGVFDIYREAYKIILSRRKIFTQITFALILPLSFISLAHTLLSNTLFPKITDQNQKDLAETQVPNSNYANIFDLLSSISASYWLLQAAYTIFSFILYLLSTSAIVYTMACIYSGREVTFKLTHGHILHNLSGLCTYHVVAFLVLLALVAVLIAFGPNTNVGLVILSVVVVLYLMGFLYMSIVWQLASTISVLEDSCGFQAMKKSNQLIRGKVGMATFIFLKLGLGGAAGEPLGMVNRVAFANVCLSLLSLLSLFERVIQTVIYFVCKSHHHENIDKLALSDHLQVYTQDYYIPLKGDNLQLKQFYIG
ncbi:hypothetical protein AAG906_018210 [Vitis piasezkii]